MTLPDAHNTVLVEDVHATFPLPPFDNSAMDGYAVRAEDVAAATAATPVTLPVVGDVAAGSTTPYTVQPGLCVRIMTGAPLPPGANAVIPLEDTDGGIAQVAIRRSVPNGWCIRRAGEDAAPGSEVLKAGTHLGATNSVCWRPWGATGFRCGPGHESWFCPPAASSLSLASRSAAARSPTPTARC